MQTPTLIDNASLILIVVALVAAVREQFPKIDGKLLVLGTANAVGIALEFLMGGDTPRNLVTKGIVVAMTAVGGMHVVAYHATKSAGTDDAADAPLAIGTGSIVAPTRGFARAGALLWVLALGAVAMCCLIFTLNACGVPKSEVKSVVDVTKGIVEEICSPADPTLDACIDKLLSDPRVVAAKKASASRRASLTVDAGADR